MKLFVIRYCFNSVIAERYQSGYSSDDAISRLSVFLGVSPEIVSVCEV